ncbi:methyltransferase family protein [Bacteroidota bacterium]
MIYVKYLIVTVFLITATLVVFRFIVKRRYKKEGKLNSIVTFAQLLIFFLHALSSYIFIETKGHHLIKDNLIDIIGITLMIIGGGFILLGMINLGIRKSFGMKAQGLKQTGFYKFSRNPQIIFYILFLTGYALIYPSWAGLTWVGILFVMCHIMVITEEEHLLRTFENEYKEYCYKTPRYLRIKISKKLLKSWNQ